MITHSSQTTHQKSYAIHDIGTAIFNSIPLLYIGFLNTLKTTNTGSGMAEITASIHRYNAYRFPSDLVINWLC
jgi:hypothetical protein